MYYLGTYNQTIYYDNKVTAAENYQSGSNWANPIQSQSDPNKWAILQACPANNCPRTYTHNNMRLVNQLPAEFMPTKENI